MMTSGRTAIVGSVVAAAGFLLGVSACRRQEAPRGNIVLVTVSSLRADRLEGTPRSPDPCASIRALAGAAGTRRILASSTETLPALVSVFTGTSPARHATLVDELDRIPEDLPTLAELFTRAGYRTAGFPSLASQGLASGLARGFRTYGWPPGDVLLQSGLAESDQGGWRADLGRRPGIAVVQDALSWMRRHGSEPLFLWIHLSDAASPYATDRSLLQEYSGSGYDAAIAYEDRCVRTLYDGVTEAGLGGRTTILVAGAHGESLGTHGESFHGLNLYPPALETAVAAIPPRGSESGVAASFRSKAGARGRAQDLFATLLALGDVPLPQGSDSRAGLPPIAADLSVLAVTLGPRSAFGWPGRATLIEGETAWGGPEDEEIFRWPDGPGTGSVDRSRLPEIRGRAQSALQPIALRLAGRPSSPAREVRAKVIEHLRDAGRARETRNPNDERAALVAAWEADPGNFDTALRLAFTNGPQNTAANRELVAKVRELGGGIPEADLAEARILERSPALGDPFEVRERACAAGGRGCVIDRALRLGRAGRFEDAAQALQPLAEGGSDADLWRTIGDLYFALENTHRAGKAYEKAAEIRPGDPDILLRQGDCLSAVRDAKGAEAKYREAARVLPGLPLVELRLGSLALAQGDRKGAVDHFRKSQTADPNTVDGAIALGRLLASQGMTAEAVPFFLDAAARDTSSSAALYLAAEALAADGRMDEAESYLRQALDRRPDDGASLLQLARLLAYKGKRVEAGALLERLAPHATPEIAITALRDPIFTNDAPDAPLAKGMRAIYERAQQLNSKAIGPAGPGSPPVRGAPAGTHGAP